MAFLVWCRILGVVYSRRLHDRLGKITRWFRTVFLNRQVIFEIFRTLLMVFPKPTCNLGDYTTVSMNRHVIFVIFGRLRGIFLNRHVISEI